MTPSLPSDTPNFELYKLKAPKLQQETPPFPLVQNGAYMPTNT